MAGAATRVNSTVGRAFSPKSVWAHHSWTEGENNMTEDTKYPKEQLEEYWRLSYNELRYCCKGRA